MYQRMLCTLFVLHFSFIQNADVVEIAVNLLNTSSLTIEFQHELLARVPSQENESIEPLLIVV